MEDYVCRCDPETGAQDKAYVENVFLWNAWPILYGGFGELLSAVQMGHVGQMLSQNSFLGGLGSLEGSVLIGFASIIFSLAIAVIPFMAKRIVSGDVGSTAGALIGAAFSVSRTGQLLALGCLAILLVIGAAPAGALLIAPLENRFPAPPANAPPPYGVIVLGGAIDEGVSLARGQTTFDEGAERLTQAAILARRYPSARII